MKKIIISILFVLSIMSCSDVIITESANLDHNYVIGSIESIDDKVLCLYNLDTNVGYIHYINIFSFRDTIGKFSVGDTIVFNASKK